LPAPGQKDGKRWPQRLCLRGSVGAKRLSYEQPNANAFCDQQLSDSRRKRDIHRVVPTPIEPLGPFPALTLCLPFHPSIPPGEGVPGLGPLNCGPSFFSTGMQGRRADPKGCPSSRLCLPRQPTKIDRFGNATSGAGGYFSVEKRAKGSIRAKFFCTARSEQRTPGPCAEGWGGWSWGPWPEGKGVCEMPAVRFLFWESYILGMSHRRSPPSVSARAANSSTRASVRVVLFHLQMVVPPFG
jgi:hypothetical protein